MRLNAVRFLKNAFKWSFRFGVSGAIFVSCTNDKPEVAPNLPSACDTASVTYAATIKPIFQAACLDAGCHCPTCPQPGGYANWNSYSGLFEYAGDSLKKLTLLQKLKHEGAAPYMPLGGTKLSDCSVSKIQRWINLGAPNN